jgi:transcriptional regulator with PAS, ATPase and Fis domain
MSATREVCAICGRVSRVGFWVPNKIWNHVIHPYYRNSIVCLSCFTERADEHLVDWSSEIQFYPVSFAAHIRGQHPHLQSGISPDPPMTMREAQIRTIDCALRRSGGSRRKAALLLDVPERTLYRMIRRYRLPMKRGDI